MTFAKDYIQSVFATEKARVTGMRLNFSRRLKNFSTLEPVFENTLSISKISWHASLVFQLHFLADCEGKVQGYRVQIP